MAFLFAGVIQIIAALTIGNQVLAGNCGGGTSCNCGDTVTSNYVLTANLGPCSGHGLIIASNVSVDGGGGHGYRADHSSS